MHILVLGAGSVGRRHLRNLSDLGCALSAMDPLEERLREAASEVDLRASYSSTEAAFADGSFDGIVVASPPLFHVEQALEGLLRRMPVLLEKPPSTDLDSTRRLAAAQQASGTPVVLGYTYRWWPPLREVKSLLEAGAVGRTLHVRCVMSAHLADWHPWEPYQAFFMASRKLGGGALLDESHFVDLIYWLFGSPRSVFARIDRISDLEIETDDNVDALFSYDDGKRVSIHLDLFGRPHEKYIVFEGSEGTLTWSFDPNRLRIGRSAAQDWEDTSFEYERNDMFVALAHEFVGVIRGSTAPSCTIHDGVEVMRILEAMRASSESGCVQAVDER